MLVHGTNREEEPVRSWLESPIAKIVSSLLRNQVAPSEIPTTEASRNMEEPSEPDQLILIPSTPMYEIDEESCQLSAEFLITVIELSVICLHESYVPSVEQMRAKRLLKGALNLHPEGFIALKTNRLTRNVDWKTLLNIYVDIKKSLLEPQQVIPPLLRNNFDDWFGGLDDFHKELLLDVLVL